MAGDRQANGNCPIHHSSGEKFFGGASAAMDSTRRGGSGGGRRRRPESNRERERERGTPPPPLMPASLQRFMFTASHIKLPTTERALARTRLLSSVRVRVRPSAHQIAWRRRRRGIHVQRAHQNRGRRRRTTASLFRASPSHLHCLRRRSRPPRPSLIS